MPNRAIRAKSLFVLTLLLFLAAPAALMAQEVSSEEADVVQPIEVVLEEIEQVRSVYQKLVAQQGKLEGDERAVVELQRRKRLLEFFGKMNELVALVMSHGEGEPELEPLRKKARALVRDVDGKIEPFLDSLQHDLSELRGARSGVPEAQRKELDEQILGMDQTFDETLHFCGDHLEHLEALGLPVEVARERLAIHLRARAEALSGRLELASRRVVEARDESAAAPSDAALEAAIRIARDRRDVIGANLRGICNLMDAIDLPTSSYRQLLIEVTGEITSDVLDTEVAKGLFDSAREAMSVWAETNGPRLISRFGVFTAIMLLFVALGGVARRSVARLLGRAEQSMSELMKQMLIGTASRVVIGIGFFVALSQMGVNVTALLTGLGIAGFVVGFALQDTLGNFASGAMILMYRPYDVGDVIEAAGVSGAVNSMNLVSTTFLTFDNQTLVVPNSAIWSGVIRNVTAQKKRRVDLTFGLSHETDLQHAEDTFASILRDDPNVLADPPPAIKVHNVTEVAIEFIVRPWVRTEDYWETYWRLNREIKLRLDSAGIEFGIPRREVLVRANTDEPS